jgi:hypothetical protein
MVAVFLHMDSVVGSLEAKAAFIVNPCEPQATPSSIWGPLLTAALGIHRAEETISMLFADPARFPFQQRPV